ncbi:MAG: PaaI family thioesterase [Pseudomonadota bacterium]|nr:PaaI family thioesterase [Pseudomonadota bacterium]
MRHPVLVELDSGVIPPSNEDLGLEFLKAENGVARFLWLPSERSLNVVGTVQGGYIAAACDAAIGYALASRLENSEGFTTVSLSVTYHRPLHPVTSEACAEVVRVGRRTAYLEASLRMEGKLVASAVSTVLIL